MKDISTPVPPDEFRKEIRNCLHQAALVNYTRVSAYAKIEGGSLNVKDDFCLFLSSVLLNHHERIISLSSGGSRGGARGTRPPLFLVQTEA